MTCTIRTTERDGQWVAHAERSDTGDRFGIECTGSTPEEAAGRLRRWLDWQAEHAADEPLDHRGRGFYRSEMRSQPRRSATRASSSSGSTATGRVTRSSSARSLCESL